MPPPGRKVQPPAKLCWPGWLWCADPSASAALLLLLLLCDRRLAGPARAVQPCYPLLSRPLPSLRFTQLRVQPPSQRSRRPLAAGAPRSSPAPCSGEDPRPSPPSAAKRAHVGHRARRPSALPSAAGTGLLGTRRSTDSQMPLQGLERIRQALFKGWLHPGKDSGAVRGSEKLRAQEVGAH